MTRAQSMDVLNDTTTMQSRIDTVLATPELDYANDSGWHPGDPLWDRPNPGPQFYPDTHEEPWLPTKARCAVCEVWWTGPAACWLCGDPETARTSLGFDPSYITFDETHEWGRASLRPFIAAMDDFARQLAQLSAPLEAFRERYSYIEWSSADYAPVEQRVVTWLGADTGRMWALDVESASEAQQDEPLAAWGRELLGLPETDVIHFPAGAVITPVTEVPLPPTISVTGRRRRPPSPRYYFDRPVTEQRRPR